MNTSDTQKMRLRTLNQLHNVRAALALEWRKTELELQMHKANAEMLSLRNSQTPVARIPLQSPAQQLPPESQQVIPMAQRTFAQQRQLTTQKFQEVQPNLACPPTTFQRKGHDMLGSKSQDHHVHSLALHGPFLTLRFENRHALRRQLQSTTVLSCGHPPQRPTLNDNDPTHHSRLGCLRPNDAKYSDTDGKSDCLVGVLGQTATLSHDQQHSVPTKDVDQFPCPHPLTGRAPSNHPTSLSQGLKSTRKSLLEGMLVSSPNSTQDQFINNPASPTTITSQNFRQAKRSASLEVAGEAPQQRPCFEQHVENRKYDTNLSSTTLDTASLESKVENSRQSMFVRQETSDEDNGDDGRAFSPGSQKSKANIVSPHRSQLHAINSSNTAASQELDHSDPTNCKTGSRPLQPPPPQLKRKTPSARSPSPSTARLRPRRAPSTYRTPEYARLPSSTKQMLELRYCAHIARMFARKSCVHDPPLPLDNENLWTRMRRRLMQPPPGTARAKRLTGDDQDAEGKSKDGNEGSGQHNEMVYTSAADFESDVKNMLMQYVRMGPCSNGKCPYARSGNSRVMCWRMRLESVLDDRMKGLKRCLKQCEESFVAGDERGMKGWVDSWFAGDLGRIEDDE